MARKHSKYIGVYLAKSGRWFAAINIEQDGRRATKYLGTFDTPEQAALAFDLAVYFYRRKRGPNRRIMES